ncbi:hypothetical protein Scep_020411 [Stephania cephalantha]|uniref:Transposase n=1 Tax=Stephania cephalantha TaxID=152367 RepID=A0AAP0IDU0_9MAGN
MTKIFKRWMITEGYCWKSVPDHQNEIYWERWKPYFRWDPSTGEAIVRAAYDAKACVRYGALMHELRALGVRPDFVTDEAWNRYRDYWASADFRASLRRLHITKKTKRVALAKLVRRREEHTQATPDHRLMRSSSTTMRRGSAQRGVFMGSDHLPEE